MLHATLSQAGVWDLTTTMSPRELPVISHNTAMSEMLYTRLLSSVLIFVDCQGCTPSFEASVGHHWWDIRELVKTRKVVLLDDPN
jgi:hypothetical protein